MDPIITPTTASDTTTTPSTAKRRLKFSAVPSFFTPHHVVAASAPDGRYSTQPHLGLDASRHSWSGMRAALSSLNREAAGGASHKLIYYTRHGQGFHNVKEAEVGTAAWDAHWSRLDGDGATTWSDPALTAEGVAQAEAAGRVWHADASSSSSSTGEPQPPQYDHAIIPPFPSAIYTSPLRRCLQTTTLAYGAACALLGLPFRPVVREALRERVTDHTCDRRSAASVVAAEFPEFRFFEPPTPLAEDDPLWRADGSETLGEHVARKRAFLEELWLSGDGDGEGGAGSHFVGIVSHSMALSALLVVLGVEDFKVREGTTFAMVVRAEEEEEGLRNE